MEINLLINLIILGLTSCVWGLIKLRSKCANLFSCRVGQHGAQVGSPMPLPGGWGLPSLGLMNTWLAPVRPIPTGCERVAGVFGSKTVLWAWKGTFFPILVVTIHIPLR